MKKTTSGILILLAVGLNTAVWLALKNPEISRENGPMENYQLICLFLAFLFWLLANFRSQNKSEKIFLLTLALFNLSFFILEVDTRKLDMPTLTKFIRGKYRNGFLACLWLGAGMAFFRNKKECWEKFLVWLKTASAICMIASGVFWIVSGLNDKHLLFHKDLYFEELMEVNATLLMLIAAIWFFLSRTVSGRKPLD